MADLDKAQALLHERADRIFQRLSLAAAAEAGRRLEGTGIQIQLGWAAEEDTSLGGRFKASMLYSGLTSQCQGEFRVGQLDLSHGLVGVDPSDTLPLGLFLGWMRDLGFEVGHPQLVEHHFFGRDTLRPGPLVVIIYRNEADQIDAWLEVDEGPFNWLIQSRR